MIERDLTRSDIEGILPHRRPFLFLETVTITELGARGTGRLTDLTHPDFVYLSGHFPNLPIVPGALIMEALAELSGVVAASSNAPALQNRVGVLIEDHMRYKQMIFPSESTTIELEAEMISLRSRLGKVAVRVIKEDKIAAEGEITFFMIDKSSIRPH